MRLSAAATFAAAFLLFALQPILARAVLPHLGGSPSVWTTCMLFFQLGLLIGYGYAHASVRYLGRAGPFVHLCLLAVAAGAGLPGAPAAGWAPAAEPNRAILGYLTVEAGLAYVVLAATTPLLQAWLSRSLGARPAPVYRLYAASNLGSLLALLAYPLVIEPAVGVAGQLRWWAGSFLGCAVLIAWCGVRSRASAGESGAAPRAVGDGDGAALARSPVAAWILLPATASVLLLAVTNELCQGVAVVPFLWVLPLALYLASFIVAFHDDRWYRRRWWLPAMGVATYALGWLLIADAASLSAHVAIYGMLLFVCAMVCHGELARLRPATRHLTAYYLSVALGGGLGGLLVAVVAPLLFDDFFELHLAVAACVAVGLAVAYRSAAGRRSLWLMAAAVVPVLGVLVYDIADRYQGTILMSRGFYGSLRILEEGSESTGAVRKLRHGGITHGLQYTDTVRRMLPTAYFGQESGIGRLLGERLRQLEPAHIGVVGLGVGSLAAYGRPGDRVRFYELSPDVARLSRLMFTYLDDSLAEVEVVIGDARVSLTAEPAQEFDVLVLDAFSGDAVPVHLLTREALAVYRLHLAHDGVLAVHVSNRYLELGSLVRGLAAVEGWESVTIATDGDPGRSVYVSMWVLLARERTALDGVGVRAAALPDAGLPGAGLRLPVAPPDAVWTDDRSALWPFLVW